jgi:hypothetical protein
MPDGSRKITHITEVSGMEGDIITLQDIFLYEQAGFNDKGQVMGNYNAVGLIPTFVYGLQRRGIEVDIKMFESEKGNT